MSYGLQCVYLERREEEKHIKTPLHEVETETDGLDIINRGCKSTCIQCETSAIKTLGMNYFHSKEI